MSATSSQGDKLVAEYLDRARAAAAGLDPARREELLEDLREHIAAARAELSPETEAGVRTILERLGDPAAIAAEASVGDAPRASSAPLPMAPPEPVTPAKSGKAGITALIVALAMVVLVPVALCVVGALGLLAFQRGPAMGEQGPVIEEIPVPSTRPS